jgi:tetratricopeptide (TPR) repeat protein
MPRLKTHARRVLVAGLAVLLVACGGAEDRKARHMERGDAYFAEANYEKARVEYKNVLQVDPKDVRARFGLGQVHERLGQWREALGQYQAVVEQDAANIEARLALGRIFLAGKAPDRVEKLAAEVLEREPDNADGLLLRAGVKVLREDNAGAVADAEAALARHPEHAQALALLGSLAAQAGDTARAVELLERGVKAEPKSAALRSVLASLYLQGGESEKAVEVFRDLVQADPDSLGHRMRLAALYTSLKRLDEAEDVLRSAIAEGRTDPVRTRLALAEFLAARRDRQAAERELKGFIEKAPETYDYRFALARVYEVGSEWDQAEAVYREVIERDRKGPKGLDARTRLARVLAQEKKLDEALRLVDEVLEENAKDEDALVLRGRLALARQDAAAAISDFRSALKGQPNSATLLTLLAQAHLANKETQLAEESLRKAVEAEPGNVPARLALARVLSVSAKPAAAIEQVDAAIRAAPGNAGILEVKARLQMAQRDWAGAVQTAKTLQKDVPDAAVGYYLEGVALQGKEDFAASALAFEQAMQRAPQAAQPLTGLVQSQLAAKEGEQAQARLDELIAQHPEHALAHNLRGEVLLLRQEYGEAESAFRRAQELSPSSPIPYRNLALARLAGGDRDGALEVYREGIKATGGSEVLRFAVAGLYEQMGRYDDAIAEHEAMLQANPDSLAVANNLAMLLVSYRTDAASRVRAKELAARLAGSDNPAFLDTLGWVQYLEGDLASALANLQKAVARAPGVQVMHYHLGMAYFKKGDAAKAREQLEKALAGGAKYPGRGEAEATLAGLR